MYAPTFFYAYGNAFLPLLLSASCSSSALFFVFGYSLHFEVTALFLREPKTDISTALVATELLRIDLQCNSDISNNFNIAQL